MNLTYSQKIDKSVSLFIVLQVTLMGVKNILVQGIPFLFEINEQLNVMITALVSVLYLFAIFRTFGRRVCTSGWLFWLFITGSILFTLLMFPQNGEIMRQYYIRWIVVFFLTSFLLTKLNTFEWLQYYMLRGSYAMTLAGVAYAVFVFMVGHSVNSDWSTYSMSMSNVVMWAVMWQLHAHFKQGNKLSLLFAIVGFMVILMYGSRNPLLAIVIYGLILTYDKYWKSNSSMSNPFIVFFTLIMMLLAVNLKPILLAISDTLGGMGIASRSIGLFLSVGTDDFSTGRDDIHKDVYKLISDNTMIGTGVCGDETQIGEMAHSLYLNIFTTYGVFIGALFLIAIVVLTLRALKAAKGLEHQILVMYLCLVFPRGFTGGDMWGSDVFWWLMGIVFMILSNKQRIRRNAVSYIRQESVSVG